MDVTFWINNFNIIYTLMYEIGDSTLFNIIKTWINSTKI